MTARLHFEWIGTSSTGITKRWAVLTTDGEHALGTVGWYTGWRRYAFFPRLDREVLFDHDCLREIASFVEQHTHWHKQGGSK